LVTQAHATKGYNILQQHQKGNPIKSTLGFCVGERKRFLFYTQPPKAATLAKPFFD